MLKFMLVIMFMIPVCFYKERCWWLVQLMFFSMMFMYMIHLPWEGFLENISFMFGYDILSYGLIALSFWICGLMIMASSSVYKSGYYSGLFLFIIIFMMLMLLCTFSSMNMLSFYIFFESSLIPTLLLILGWGYQPERLQAGIYLLFYTLFASLPLLVALFMLYEQYGSLSMFMYKGNEVDILLMYICMVVAFLVKMPMFMVHLWLPSAHVEAPISGSMILAGVLLKLGGYGLLRLFGIMMGYGMKLNYIWIGIGLFGGLLVSLICLRQVDMSALIAYSSVAHMGIMLGGMMTLNYWGVCGSYLMMIGHGLCSSGLFCLSNMGYERLGSRSLIINKGLLNLMPSLSLWWFLLSSSNMAAPPSLNLLAEISLINSMMMWCGSLMMVIMLLSFFSAAYSLYLYSLSQHGMVFSGLYSCVGGVSREYMLLLMHWLPLNMLILNVDIFFSYLL